MDDGGGHRTRGPQALMLLLEDAKLEERRAAARGPLASLYESLVAELEPLLARSFSVPEAKALLSRAGGRCEADGSTLDFDPWSPHAHRCPACERLHKGELHHRAWVTSYQLWLAERALQAALFHLLRGDERHATLARDILRALSDRYLGYPNRDNVLGPTRLFFSTYLESIWLLQVCVAADLLARSGDRTTADIVRDRIVEPSTALIGGYHEGMSNRQVWNNAAMLASASLCGDERAIERVFSAPSGLRAHLERALLPDGTWYEGENYHVFALRGLWYGVTLMETRGRWLEPRARERFHLAFAAPFLTALPDFTMPSRKDSQYAVSLRQWRIAELTELGFARTDHALLAAALARCYEPGHERRDTGRARSTADVERNVPGSALTRADLGWRALLHALPELSPGAAARPRSALLEDQGYAVFRRDGDIYVGFEFGQPGGGHGHPDRLNIVLAQGATRWLDDMGTGSYVDPSLNWYRSTLAHNAPIVNGRSQPLRAGELLAYDEREGMGWIVARFDVNEVSLERTVVVAPDYVLDELQWNAPGDVRIELPWHLEPPVRGETHTVLDGGDGLEDGFAYVRDATCVDISANQLLFGKYPRNGRTLLMWLDSNRDYAVYDASAPGQPPLTERRFMVVRAHAASGAFRAILTWNSLVARADFDADGVAVQFSGGERHQHRRTGDAWHVELSAGGARSSIDLSGVRPRPSASFAERPRQSSPAPMVLRRSAKAPDGWYSELSSGQRSALLTFELGESHYRRSEESWRAADSPRATVALAADDSRMVLFASIAAGDPVFAAATAENRYDNESADTMRAGLQLYVRSPDGRGGWMLVPEVQSDAVRVRAIADWGTLFFPVARWRAQGNAYEIRVEIPFSVPLPAEYPLHIDLIINETTPDRERRRGQLVMSGARGEFVYLRGDRHDGASLIPLVLVP